MLLAATLAAQLLAAACLDRNVKVTNPLPPDVSEAWLKAHKPNGTVLLTVDVDAQGHVTSVTIKSATASLPDEFVKASVKAARDSTYAPAMHDCKAVAGSYLFRVETKPDTP